MNSIDLINVVEEAKARREYAGELLTQKIRESSLSIGDLAKHFSQVWNLTIPVARSVIRGYQEGKPSSSHPTFKSVRAPNAPIYNIKDVARLGGLFRYLTSLRK
jgi:hypothetical protein